MAKLKKIKIPPYPELERCISLRMRSKRGEHLSPGDTEFVAEMWRKYPDWYHDTEREVFIRTAPFGSNC